MSRLCLLVPFLVSILLSGCGGIEPEVEEACAVAQDALDSLATLSSVSDAGLAIDSPAGHDFASDLVRLSHAANRTDIKNFGNAAAAARQHFAKAQAIAEKSVMEMYTERALAGQRKLSVTEIEKERDSSFRAEMRLVAEKLDAIIAICKDEGIKIRV